MSWWYLWCFIIFLLSLFQTCFLSSLSPQLCPDDERSALLQLKQKHFHVYDNYDPLNSWKPNTDCCCWKGITCNGTTSHVVGLDLFDLSLNGSIQSNSSLFHLHQLQMLNLSSNAFYGRIPSQISQLTDLVSLDLSKNQFWGQIPSEISWLTKLVSLDLSHNGLSKVVFSYLYRNGSPQLEIPNLREFVQNLSMLRELRLDWVNLSGQKNRDWCHHLSSALPNLHVLSMSDCSLTGPLDASISSLRFLSELHLDSNYDISSKVPSSLMNLTSLSVLSLWDCGFHGEFPTNVFLLPNLKLIDLYGNPLLSGHLPEFPQVNSSLQYLYVSKTKFQGKFPSSVGNLKFLKGLQLSGFNFSGPIPHSLANLTHLTWLDLSNNSFSGQIPSYFFFLGRFPNLEYLWLDNNLLQGPIDSYLFFLPSLSVLELSYNQFSGIINEPIHNISFVSSPWVYLSGNNFKGHDLMRLIFKIKRTFELLDISLNDLGYMVEDTTNLSCHSLSVHQLLMTSCNISKFPDFLRNQNNLTYLDLSGNMIDGAIPKWIWQNNLVQLNLSNNFFTGVELPILNGSVIIDSLDLHSNMIQDYCLSTVDSCIPQTSNQSKSEFVSPILGNLTFILDESTSFFSISGNKLTGKIPFSICNASNLDILDLSNNQLSGTIPTCLGSKNLGVLNLERNKLHGPIPPTFKNGCRLHALYLNENMLQGKVPRTLGNCKQLTVLDIADNQLNGIFPYWLENLSELQVLVMRSNKFCGPIAQLPQSDSPFPSLHVIDLSFNNFTGNLPLQYICHWKAMIFYEDTSKLNYTYLQNLVNYSVDVHYQDTLAIMEKGLYLNMPRILTTFTAVDLSNNNFNGNIPDAFGILKALIVLNLSGNSLTGQIPFSLGNISELESLDLSRNKLSGEIPRKLTSLTFLEVLNLSYNNFTGSIPRGRQFDTFSNTSYEGNTGLCGLPLSRKCGITDRALPPTSVFQQNDDSECLFDWKFALAGYCSGLIIGVVVGNELFWRKGRCYKFFSRALVSKQKKRTRKIKHHNIEK